MIIRGDVPISTPVPTPDTPLPQFPQPSASLLSSREKALHQACLCAQLAEDNRGTDTLVLDLTQITPIMDYFIVTTGTSGRQMRALSDHIDNFLEEQGVRRIGMEGKDNANWILYDYGDIVVHVFSPEARQLYDLEHLWADAPQVDWKAHLQASPVASA